MRLSALVMVGMVVFAFPAPPASASDRERPLTFVDLPYPSEALATRTDGVVIAEVTTDRTGRILEARPVVGPALLARAVVANVKGWTLAPGPPTDWIVFRFEIESGACNDDGRSLFRLARANLAVVTACTGSGRRAGAIQEDPLLLRSLGRTPGYPPLAQSANVRGVIVLELSVDGDGAVTAARALNDLPLLAPAAIAHARTWRVWPGRTGPRYAVYEFALDHRECDDTSTVVSRVSANYVRLSGCIPNVEVATREGA